MYPNSHLLNAETLEAEMDDEQMLTLILDLLDRFARRRGIETLEVLENILDLAVSEGITDLANDELIDQLMEQN
jgi:hypothetical protein